MGAMLIAAIAALFVEDRGQATERTVELVPERVA
jgi:hypothetical protein